MDWEKLLGAMVPLGVALARPGQSGASFVQGFQESDQLMWRRKMEEEEAARRNSMAQYEMRNRDADNQRAEQQARLNRLAMALQQMNPAIEQQAEFSSDPMASQVALGNRSRLLERSFDLQPGAMQPFTPDAQTMAPMISSRQIKRAQAKVEELKKTYGDQLGALVEADSLKVKEGEFAGMPVADLYHLAQMEPPPKAQPKPRPEPAPGSFEEYVNLPPDQQRLRETQRKRYMQADDRPQTGATIVVHTVDDQGNPVTRVVPKTPGAEFAAPPPAAEQAKRAGRSLVMQSIEAVRSIGDRVIRRVGPSQRAEAIKRGAEAVFGNDPEFRVYEDARMALAGNLAVAQQGSRPSDADIKAIWLPMVPDAYRDTSESARMKWDLINTMMATPTRAPAAPSSGTIRARDPQGKLHEAPAGTPLPAGWTLVP